MHKTKQMKKRRRERSWRIPEVRSVGGRAGLLPEAGHLLPAPPQLRLQALHHTPAHLHLLDRCHMCLDRVSMHTSTS
jgi:hypothetical protein